MTTQVSVIGPAGVIVLCTVVTVVASEARRNIGAAFVEVRRVEMKQKNSKKAKVDRIMLSIANYYEEGLKDSVEPGSCGISTM